MPAYHSKFAELPPNQFQEACGCALLPLHAEIRGPADVVPAGQEDIIDEAIFFFRANTLFRNFDVRCGADKTLIYITLFIQFCLVKLEKIEDKTAALRELRVLATKQFPIPGEAGWPLGTLFASPANRMESDNFKGYFKQVREEIALRIVNTMWDTPDGAKSKWWQAYSKRKFMGKELQG